MKTLSIHRCLTIISCWLLILQSACAVGVQKAEKQPPYATPTIGEFFVSKTAVPTAPLPPTKAIKLDLVVQVDVNRNVHPISPLIYGVSGASSEVLETLHPSLNSWGGNPSTRYNWQIGHAWNAGSDWDYRNGNYGTQEGSASDHFINEAKAAGISARLALPILGWVAKDDNNNTCSFPQPDGSCGDAGNATCENPGATADPNTANIPSDTASIKQWLEHLQTQPGWNSVRFLAMDNEPELWGITHYDVHPTCTTYKEILEKYLEYATVAHEAAPKAELVGPVTCCWYYYWNSAAGAMDKVKHGNQDFLPWFLASLQAHDEQTGWRSLDVLDIHYYPEGLYNNDVDEVTAAHRLRSTRSLWDQTYVDESWINQPIFLIPRMRQIIEENYPGTRLGISEWNWGADNSINGALAIADVLGIYGREELYYASYWTYPALDSPGANAFKIYTNYDGKGAHFGDTSVFSEAANSKDISSYAAIDSHTGNLHLILINRNPAAKVDTLIQLGGYLPEPEGKRYQFSQAQPNQIVESTFDHAGSEMQFTLPPYSISLFVFEGKEL